MGGAADKDNQTHGTTFSWVLGVRSTEITERDIFYSSVGLNTQALITAKTVLEH